MKMNPEKFQIKHLTEKDVPVFQKLILVFHEVFEMQTPINAGEDVAIP